MTPVTLFATGSNDLTSPPPDTSARPARMATASDQPSGWERASGLERVFGLERAEFRRLEQDIRRALGAADFALLYQPRYQLRPHRPVGAEALIRWQHRKRGLVPPGLFLPVAEQSGLINEIGGFVLHAACVAAAGWPSSLGVSVNISARQLLDGVLLDQVAAALEATALDPERLELEVTETILLDLSLDVQFMLAALRDLGVGLALDDFGTGHTSLATLKRLPFTVMKIDRSVVRTLPRDREDAAIVRAIVGTAQALGLSVVAEGIENAEQEAFLAAIGCDSGQGFLFSPPLSGHEIISRLGAGV